MLDLTPFFTPELFNDAFIKPFGYLPKLCFTPMWISFSHCPFSSMMTTMMTAMIKSFDPNSDSDDSNTPPPRSCKSTFNTSFENSKINIFTPNRKSKFLILKTQIPCKDLHLKSPSKTNFFLLPSY